MTILSSRDLCAVSFLDKLATAGVTSFKIEGRMKSPYYVATVVNVYRRALDALARGETPDQAFLMKELGAASHRPFSRGFYFGEIPFESAAGGNDFKRPSRREVLFSHDHCFWDNGSCFEEADRRRFAADLT